MIILRQKSYATAVHLGNGEVALGANSTLPTAKDSAFLSLPKMADNKGKSGTNKLIEIAKTEGAKNNAGRVDAARTLGGAEYYQKSNLTASQAAKAGYNLGKARGQSSVGALGGMKNSWNNMSTVGKVGTAAAAIGATALAAKGIKSMFDKKKED